MATALSTTQGQGFEVPPYFLCPISLQIMRDPVTLPTGITYDRDGIERWLFSGAGEEETAAAAATCPVSKQPVPHDAELTPNHTLRRLIQAWCVANASHGVERFPTPRPPVDKAQIARLLEEARMAPEAGRRLASLRKLRDIVGESERNRRSAEAAGAIEFLISVVWDDDPAACAGDQKAFSSGGAATCEEALCVLHALKVSPAAFCELCVLLQMDCAGGMKAKEKASEVLRMHSTAWKNSPCVPPQLLASFPRSINKDRSFK